MKYKLISQDENKSEEHYNILKEFFKYEVSLEQFLQKRIRIKIIRDTLGIMSLCSYAILPDHAHINFIVTAPRVRKIGVAKDLLEDVIADISVPITCAIRESNIASIALFEGFGFKRVGEDKYSNGELKIKYRRDGS